MKMIHLSDSLFWLLLSRNYTTPPRVRTQEDIISLDPETSIYPLFFLYLYIGSVLPLSNLNLILPLGF